MAYKYQKEYGYSKKSSKKAAVLDYKHNLKTSEKIKAGKYATHGVLMGAAASIVIGASGGSAAATAMLPFLSGVGYGSVRHAINHIGNKPIRKAIDKYQKDNKIDDDIKAIEKKHKDAFLIEKPNRNNKTSIEDYKFINNMKKINKDYTIDDYRKHIKKEDLEYRDSKRKSTKK